MRKIIITGDDFGLARPVNEAIVQAHCAGTITTASLMVGADFAEDAVRCAKLHPSLKVGLHLVLVEGRSILPASEIPDLVDGQGMFCEQLLRAGFRFFFRPGIRKQLEAEIRAQFERFVQTGLELDHVNAHNHMHVHPTILNLILKIGREFGVRAIRLPHEPPIRSWQAAGKSLISRSASWLLLSPWIQLMRRRLRKAKVNHNDYIFGMSDSGRMTLDLVLKIIKNLPVGVTELYFHPATRRCAEIERTMPHYRHEDEFRTLVSSSLVEALNTNRISRIAFGNLARN